jgi:hypothetical protein
MVRDEDATPPDTRYRKVGGGWGTGWYRATLDDGSIEVTDQHTGGIRTLLRSKVEFRTYGPRGAQLWTSAEEVERPMDRPT